MPETANIPSLDANASGSANNSQFRFVVDTLLQHWLLVLTITAVAAATGGIIGKVLEQDQKLFGAQSDLVVRESFWHSNAMQSLGGNVFGKTTPKSIADETDLVDLSTDVARALLQDGISTGAQGGQLTGDEEIASEAAYLQGVIALEPYDDQNLLRIRTRSQHSAEDAARIAEFATRALIDHVQRRRLDGQEQAHAIVRQQLSDLRSQLDSAESRQWTYRETLGFQTHRQLWEDMERKNAELLETMATREETSAKLTEIDAALAANDRQLPDALGNVTESVVRDLLIDLDALRREQIEMSVVWKPTYPGLQAVSDDIAEKKQSVLVAIEELNGGPTGGSNLWQRRQDLYRQKVNLNLEITAMDIRQATLQRMLGEMVDTLPSLADKSFEYEQLAHEAQQIRGQFNKLMEKEFEIKTALNRGSGTVDRRGAVVEVAMGGAGRSGILANVLIGAVIGLLISMGLAFMMEMMDTSIQSIDDVNEYLKLEVIGMIPEMKFGKRRFVRKGRGANVVATNEGEVDACIVTQYDPKSPVSEAYRSLRTNFQFATLHGSPKTIMFTSSVPAEGKTTTAANFAVTMADRGIRVVIVDTDLRRPNVHRVLKMERGPGLADVLRDEVSLEDVIRPTRTENLWLISSGRVPPNPSELIGSQRMENLVKQLGEMFDLVVCDAPSALVVTDPVLLATYVDTTVLVVAASKARRETIQRAKKLIETASRDIAGVVLNGLEANARHYYYYYYYYDDRARHGRRKWYHAVRG